MFLTPALNLFIAKVPRRMVEVILLMYYTYAFVFGWILWADSGFEAGNTTLSFVGLYMLARYVKTYHSERIIRINGGYLWAWFTCVVGFSWALWALPYAGCSEHSFTVVKNEFYSYLSPFVILMSLLLLLGFSQFNFSSKFINWLAISAFASVLLHGPMMDDVYCKLLFRFFENSPVWLFVVKSFGMMSVYFFAGVLIDKVRIYLWNKIYIYIEKYDFNYRTSV